jgi:hypothetical protein
MVCEGIYDLTFGFRTRYNLLVVRPGFVLVCYGTDKK